MHTLVILLFVAVTLVIAWLVVVKLHKKPENVLLVAAAIFGILLNIVLVPGMIPDETAHVETAYRYSNLMLFKPFATESGGILERAADAPLSRLSYFIDAKGNFYEKIASEWEFFCTGEGAQLVEVEGRNVGSGFIAYLPAAIGLTLGRLMHLGTWPMLYLARLMNLAFYVLCLYFAIRIAPVKKFMFALAGLTPMAMQLACSFSYDVPIIGLAFVLTAYLLKLCYAVEHIGKREWIMCCGLSFLLIPCKFGYITILLLLFLIAPSKLGGRGKKALFILAVALSGLIGFIPQNLDWFRQYLPGVEKVMSDTSNTRNVELYTLGWVKDNLFESVQIILHTIRQSFDFFWSNMLTGRLTVFEPVVNWSLFTLIALVIGSAKTPEDTIAIPARHRLVCLVGFIVTFLGSLCIMMFMYTPYGSEVVEGVQGRYFLPVLPLLLLALSSDGLSMTDGLKRWLTVTVLTLNGAALIEVLMQLLERM